MTCRMLPLNRFLGKINFWYGDKRPKGVLQINGYITRSNTIYFVGVYCHRDNLFERQTGNNRVTNFGVANFFDNFSTNSSQQIYPGE